MIEWRDTHRALANHKFLYVDGVMIGYLKFDTYGGSEFYLDDKYDKLIRLKGKSFKKAQQYLEEAFK